MSKKQQQRRRKRKSKAQQQTSRLAFATSGPNDGLAASPSATINASESQSRRSGSKGRQPAEPQDQVAELIEIGLAALRRQRFEQAQNFFEQAIHSDQRSAAAWSAMSLAQLGQNNIRAAETSVRKAIDCGLASCAHQLGFGVEMFREQDFKRAEICFRLAVLIQPELCEAHNNLANAAHRLGKLDDAVSAYTQALRIQPDFTAALYNRGVAQKQRGEFELAIESMEKALAIDPNYVDAMCNLGQIAQLQKRTEAALYWFEMAAERRPENPDIAYCLGNICLEASRHAAAILHYQRALALRPNHPDSLNNLGACQACLKRDAEAQVNFEKSLEVDSNFGPALENLGDLHSRGGAPQAAVDCFTRLLNAHGQNATILLKKGRALTQLQDYAAAEDCFRSALRLQPTSAEPLEELGMVNLRLGNCDHAKAYLDRAIAAKPANAKLAYSRAIALPVIYENLEQLDEARQQLAERLDEIKQAQLRLDPMSDSADTLFYLSYQGRNDREIHTAASSLFVQHDLTRGRRCNLDRPLRVGFLTRFLTDHTVGMLSGGLMANLNPELFTSVTLPLNSGHAWFRRNTNEFRVLSNNVRQLAAEVAELELDILVYPEIGMDPLTNLAARLRLAPVQCAMWGHPVTTGIPVIDYFVSSQHLETPEADTHYSEELVRLDRLPAFYYRPQAINELKSRQQLGLPDNGALFGCPQSLFKIHPEFDTVLDRILDGQPEARIVLIEGPRKSWTERLQRRLEKTMQHSQRVQFIPRLNGTDFYALLKVIDVMLDPLHFGGGRSNYLAMAAGTPLLTAPSPYMRGRVASGMYRLLDYGECVCDSVDQYVDKAIQLGVNADYRHQVGCEIKSRSDLLFDDHSAVEAFQGFLLAAACKNAA